MAPAGINTATVTWHHFKCASTNTLWSEQGCQYIRCGGCGGIRLLPCDEDQALQLGTVQFTPDTSRQPPLYKLTRPLPDFCHHHQHTLESSCCNRQRLLHQQLITWHAFTRHEDYYNAGLQWQPPLQSHTLRPFPPPLVPLHADSGYLWSASRAPAVEVRGSSPHITPLFQHASQSLPSGPSTLQPTLTQPYAPPHTLPKPRTSYLLPLPHKKRASLNEDEQASLHNSKRDGGTKSLEESGGST